MILASLMTAGKALESNYLRFRKKIILYPKTKMAASLHLDYSEHSFHRHPKYISDVKAGVLCVAPDAVSPSGCC